MPAQSRYDFLYVHTDIPEGMTIREWRALGAAQRAAARLAAREERRRRSLVRRALAHLAALGTRTRRPRYRRREAHA
jgi:hypothetical protein